MSTVNENLKPKGVYHCRGGIERYVKTFPKGGFWRGKNYLFDRRMEQTPEVKDKALVENDVDSKCCVCRTKWTVYRGQFKCSQQVRCGVPVIVCPDCTNHATAKPESLICELCRSGYKPPSEVPDLVSMKRKADEMISTCLSDGGNVTSAKSSIDNERAELVKKPKVYYDNRLFFRRLPLTANFQKIKDAIGEENISALLWITDQHNGGFYGSCVAQMASADCKKQVLERHMKNGIRVDKKKIKVAEVYKKGDEELFRNNFVQMDYPPIGNYCK